MQVTHGARLRAALQLALTVLLASCVLTTSFDEYKTGVALYGVSGTVDGLGASEQISLSQNGDVAHAITVGNGPFAFPPALLDGAAFRVTPTSVPATRVCAAASGIIAGHDATGVAIHCLATDATLSALSISAAPLRELFSPELLAYTAGPIRVSPFLSPTTTTTVTAKATAPNAHVSIDGVDAIGGVPSAPISLVSGHQTINVDVVAPDQSSKSRYTIDVTGAPSDYFKASNTGSGWRFGWAVALSGDGTTLAVGADSEAGGSTGVNGNQTDLSLPVSGAVFVFVRTGAVWTQQAYVKASNTRLSARFGHAVALSKDGNTLAVGADNESSNATGIDGNQADASMTNAGAVYVFSRTGSTWAQDAYLKPSNTRANALFGGALALSSDGTTLAVGSDGETSSATGVDGSQADASLAHAGAAYVFTKSGGVWSQQAYVKASNTRASSSFGFSIGLSADGNTLAVGAPNESSAATGVGGNQADTSSPGTGSVYVYERLAGKWSQNAYVKASNSGGQFGFGLALSADGATLAVGAPTEASGATGIDGNQNDQTAFGSGAVYVLARGSTTWSQQAYVKASNTRAQAAFGLSMALAADGNVMVVGSPLEVSNATGMNGDQMNASANAAGAVYAFTRLATLWAQRAYMKASNTRQLAYFGSALTLTPAGDLLGVGSYGESGGSVGVNGDQSNGTKFSAGAVYVF